MTSLRTRRALAVAALIIASGSVITLLAAGPVSTTEPQESAPDERPYVFNDKNELIRPEGYREWVYIGTPVTPNDMNGGNAPFPEFHSVYIDPDSFDHYKRTGEFRDGTILTKELITVGSKEATSGAGYFMGEFIGLEATIKDSTRFADEPGNWAYFSFGHELPLAGAATAFPASDCNACHESAAAEDFVFTQYYPVLRAAKGGAPDHADADVHDGATCPECRETLDRFKEVNDDAAPGVTAVPTDPDELHAWLKAGTYKDWPHESMRSTSSPHLDHVITYLNTVLDKSMASDSRNHPVGAASVKELFDENKQFTGWAVSAKTEPDSDRGNGWFWYESFNLEDPKDIVAVGQGARLCIGCHARGGRDLVKVPYPFE